MSLKNKTIVITGGSRGIGRAIALKCAKNGANIVIMAKTDTPHPVLPGTIYTVSEEIESAGGQCLPLKVDIRNEHQVQEAVQKALDRFGGIDSLINNASAIQLSKTLETPINRYDLMMAVNVRGTFITSQACLPHLLKASNPHVLTLSPPLTMDPKWLKNHLAYTLSKYGMSLCTLGLAEEFRNQGVAFNSLWPVTVIATDALRAIDPNLPTDCMRKPDIVADAAYVILQRPAKTCTGNFFTDEEILLAEGIKDLSLYSVNPGNNLIQDFFLD